MFYYAKTSTFILCSDKLCKRSKVLRILRPTFLSLLVFTSKNRTSLHIITKCTNGDVRASESCLLNFSCGSFEEISPIESCRELNSISFEIRQKFLK